MRRSTASLGAAVALALAATGGCTREAGCPPARCDTAVVVTAAQPDVLFPPLSGSDVSVGLADLLFSKLADVGMALNTQGDAGFVPGLARAWRFEDSLTISFALRPEARWHDGAPVTAEDVVFSFDVYRDTLVGSPVRSRLARIASVTAPDRHVVTFRFHHSYPEQFFDAVYHVRILPRHLLDSVPRARLASHSFGTRPVGSGPYRFVRWQAVEFVELAANSTFFLGRPGIGRVIWRFTGEPVAAVTALLAGEADIMPALGSPENVRRVAGVPNLTVLEYPLGVYGFIGFNLRDPRSSDRPHPLFGDRALRRALAMAVDREAVVLSVLGEHGSVPVGPVGLALWIAREGVTQLAFDSATARGALAALGWRDTDGDGIMDRGGRRLEFELLVPSTSAVRQRAAVVVQEQFRRLGVAVRLKSLEFNAFMSSAAAHRFDAYFGMWAHDPSPAAIAEIWTSAGLNGSNFGRYVNPALDALVQQALNAPDPATGRARWREAVSVINSDAPAIWLLAPMGLAGIDRRFENVSIRPDQWTATLWTWRVSPSAPPPRDVAK